MILYAVASRDLATAQKAQKQFGFTKAHGSYAALVDDPDIDIVYVSVPNAFHYEWASKALKAGKHVLCEKPFTANADEAKRLVQLGKEKGLVIEEAVCILSRAGMCFANEVGAWVIVPLAIPSRCTCVAPDPGFRQIWTDPSYGCGYDGEDSGRGYQMEVRFGWYCLSSISLKT